MTTRRGGSPSGESTPASSLTRRSARIHDARALLRARDRREQGRFLVEGPQAVREALGVRGPAVMDLFVTDNAAARHPEIVASARDAGVAVARADDDAIASLSGASTPQGMVAICRDITVTLDEVMAHMPRLIVAMEQVRDPGNAGAVMRVADAAGAGAFLLSASSVDPYNDKVVRASTGSLFHVPLVRDLDLVDAVARIRQVRPAMQVLVADGRGDDLDDLSDAGALEADTLWLFGNEAWGVPEGLLQIADRVVRVPIYGQAESLNLATAAAVCLYASARVHRHAAPRA